MNSYLCCRVKKTLKNNPAWCIISPSAMKDLIRPGKSQRAHGSGRCAPEGADEPGPELRPIPAGSSPLRM